MILAPRFRDALAYAATIHTDQLRKGTDIPYISHLLAVTAIVLEHGGDEDEAIAALLHDAVEDHKATRQDIASRFGDAVAAIVEGCTDTDKQPKPPWRQRKEEHIARLRAAARSVQLVVAADKLHNARSILADYRALGEGLWSRFNADRDSILWYYRSVREAFTAAPKAMVEELGRVVAEIERLVDEQDPATQYLLAAIKQDNDNPDAADDRFERQANAIGADDYFDLSAGDRKVKEAADQKKRARVK